MRARLVWTVFALLVVAGLTAFLAAAQHHGTIPAGDYTPRRLQDWHLSGPDADARRMSLLLRAEYRVSPPDAVRESRLGVGRSDSGVGGETAPPACRFLNDRPTGTTAKFNCVVNGGMVIKVKYGRNPEIQGEVAGTHLLRALGFPADDVEIVPRLRCYGCPRDPFATVLAGTWTFTRTLLGPDGFAHGYTDFDWVAIERRFPAPAIETDHSKGWAWWEVRHGSEHRDDLDALRLLAVFLAHWDNKPENQRLVCLDDPPIAPAGTCERPLAMIQDLGATFGPAKVNIGRWATVPIWDDRTTCRVSMRTLPWGGGTFPDVEISEGGRRQIADGLHRLTDDEIVGLFRAARFAEFQTATNDDRDLREWLDVFRARAREIDAAGACPAYE